MDFEQEAIVTRVKELVGPVLASRQIELVELIYGNAGGRILLRFLVDRPRGVTVSEISSLNRAIGAILEEYDVIPGAYMLEVSSPGLDRPLRTPIDFERVIGRRVSVSTAVPVNSKREHAGELLNANEEAIILKLDQGDKLRILISEIAYAVQEIKL